MKVAIAGGSAASTPWLFDTPEIRRLQGRIEACLVGRSEQRLRAVKRAIEIVTGTTVAISTDASAFDGASLVVLQARYGGYAARARDERFPLRYGVCGDEGLRERSLLLHGEIADHVAQGKSAERERRQPA